MQKAEARGDERSVTPKENWVAPNPCNGFQEAMQVFLHDSSLTLELRVCKVDLIIFHTYYVNWVAFICMSWFFYEIRIENIC